MATLKTLFYNSQKLTGGILLVIAIILLWIDSDIFREYFIEHRPVEQLQLQELVLPVILLILGLFLLFKRKNGKS